MIEREFLRDITIKESLYSIAIVSFMIHFLLLFVNGFELSDTVAFILLGFLSIVFLLLGLFVFNKSLSMGLTFSGILTTRLALYYFNFRLPELWKFAIAMLSLSVVCVALYYLYINQQATKKK